MYCTIDGDINSAPRVPPIQGDKSFDYTAFLKDIDRRTKAAQLARERGIGRFCQQEGLVEACGGDMAVVFGAIRVLTTQLHDEQFLARVRQCGHDLRDVWSTHPEDCAPPRRMESDEQKQDDSTVVASLDQTSRSTSLPCVSVTTNESLSYEPVAIARVADGITLHDVPAAELQNSLAKLVEVEGPITELLVLDCVRRGYAMTALRGSTRTRVIEALSRLVTQGVIERDSDETYTIPHAPIRVRDRSRSDALVRTMVNLPMSEMREAACEHLARNGGVTPLVQTQRAVAERLGFSSVCAPLAQRFERAIRPLLESGTLIQVDGALRLRDSEIKSAAQGSAIEDDGVLADASEPNSSAVNLSEPAARHRVEVIGEVPSERYGDHEADIDDAHARDGSGLRKTPGVADQALSQGS